MNQLPENFSLTIEYNISAYTASGIECRRPQFNQDDNDDLEIE